MLLSCKECASVDKLLYYYSYDTCFCGILILDSHMIFLQVTTKPIVIYPNSGETYDADLKEWVVSLFHVVLLLQFKG